jgi:hypothetical protein
MVTLTLCLLLSLTLSLTHFPTTHSTRHRSCKAGWLKNTLFGHSHTHSHTHSLTPTKTIILGDSNFVFIMKEFVTTLQAIATKTRVSHYKGCESHKHLHVERGSEVVWKTPKELGINAGPYTHGLKEPFCPDCSTCDAELYEFTYMYATSDKTTSDKTTSDKTTSDKTTSDNSTSDNTTTSRSEVFRLEYFPLLFGKDVTIQSKKYLTTQEHLVDYLKSSGYGPHDFIVFNVGLHEMSHTTLHNYGINFKFLTDLLASTGSKLIFVNTPHSNLAALPPVYETMYSIELTDQFNEVAAEILKKNRNVIGTVDTAANSLVGTELVGYYRDGHHYQLSSGFYKAIVMQTLYIMCSGGQEM